MLTKTQQYSQSEELQKETGAPLLLHVSLGVIYGNIFRSVPRPWGRQSCHTFAFSLEVVPGFGRVIELPN